jgi:hypothetical protein
LDIRRLLVANNTKPLYSIRKLQDWTSNQLYRWRAALKKGNKPPSPALRQHMTNGATEPPALPETTPAQGVQPPAEGRKPRGRRAAGRKPAAKPDQGLVDVVSQPAGRPDEASDNLDALSRHISIATDLDTLELPEFDGEEMQDEVVCEALGRGDIRATTRRGDADRREAARAVAALPSFDSWELGKQLEVEEMGTSTPVGGGPAASAMLLPAEQQPVQDMEEIFSMETDEEDSHVSAADLARTSSSPVWEVESGKVTGSGVSSPDLFSPTRPEKQGNKRSLAPFDDDEEEMEEKDMAQTKRQAVMITEPTSFELVPSISSEQAENAEAEAAALTRTSSVKKAAVTEGGSGGALFGSPRPTMLSRIGSWGALSSLSSHVSLSGPGGALGLGRCESSKECFSPPVASSSLERSVSGVTGGGVAAAKEDAGFLDDLSEWGSTTLSRQRSWGAPADEVTCC